MPIYLRVRVRLTYSSKEETTSFGTLWSQNTLLFQLEEALGLSLCKLVPNSALQTQWRGIAPVYGQIYLRLRFHSVLHYAQTTGSAQDHPDQCKSSLLSKIEGRTPEPDWEEGQHFRKLEIQKKKSRVLQEVCLLSSPLNYVIWKPLVSMSRGQKWKAELPVFKGGTFYRKKAWSLARTPTSHEEAFVQRPLLQAQLYYFWKRRGRRLDFGASGKVIANKPSNCSVKIWQVQN